MAVARLNGAKLVYLVSQQLKEKQELCNDIYRSRSEIKQQLAESAAENERLRGELDFMYKIMTSLDDIHEATKIIKEKYGIKEPK